MMVERVNLASKLLFERHGILVTRVWWCRGIPAVTGDTDLAFIWGRGGCSWFEGRSVWPQGRDFSLLLSNAGWSCTGVSDAFLAMVLSCTDGVYGVPSPAGGRATFDERGLLPGSFSALRLQTLGCAFTISGCLLFEYAPARAPSRRRLPTCLIGSMLRCIGVFAALSISASISSSFVGCRADAADTILSCELWSKEPRNGVVVWNGGADDGYTPACRGLGTYSLSSSKCALTSNPEDCLKSSSSAFPTFGGQVGAGSLRSSLPMSLRLNLDLRVATFDFFFSISPVFFSLFSTGRTGSVVERICETYGFVMMLDWFPAASPGLDGGAIWRGFGMGTASSAS